MNNRRQHSVQWMLVTAACGGVRTLQAVSYALSFFWLDGFAVPALVVELVETQRRYPLKGTMAQTVGWQRAKSTLETIFKGVFYG